MADGDDKKTVIAGAGGGKGGGGRKPVEAPDTLHSIASAQVLDLVSEGPIVGFATENPLESIYLDETPLANPDGSLNFKDVQVEYRYGTQDQDYIKGFPSVENEILANVELRADTPFVRSITNTELSAVRVRLSVQGLSKVDEETNDLLGHHVAYAIDLATDGGAYKNVLSTAFSGKTTSEYARSHRIDLPPSTSGWTLRVRRITPNSESATVNDTTIVQATTEIIDAKLRYPNSAIVGTKVNAEQFPTIPRRAFDLVGRIVRVPSNYDPIARTYDGIWDGTFKPEWTDNPAWIYYDAVLHDRYGLGHRIESHQVDQWALYRIARICDEMVPDGKGGLEPRYTCNIFIQEQVEAYRLLRDLASVFNGIAYYADNRVIAGIDAPSDAVVAYSNADVIDGRFTYSGSGKSTRATVALVTWYDPDDFHRPKIEPVVDDAGVARYGIEQIDLIATGCTSQGQAQRAGWWALLTGRLETEGVSFSLGLNGTFAMPGQIIKIADQHRAGRRIGGRVSAATQNVVTIDHIPDVAPKAGDKLSAMLSNGFVEQREVLSVDGNELTTTPFTSPPVAGGAWLIETSELVATTWRVVSVTEEASGGEGNSGLTFNVSAVEHAPEKFAAIDGGAMIEGPPTTQLPSTVQPAPTSVTLSAVERAGHVVASPMLAIEWPQTAGAVRYGVAYRRDDGEWVEMPTTTGTRVEVSNVFKGTYLAQVWAYNSAGVTSSRTTSDPFVFGDQTMVPGVIADHEDRIEQSTQQLADQQAAIDQEIADRIAGDLQTAQDAADDATAKANAARDTALAAAAAAQAAVDALAADVAEIVGAPEWDPAETYEAGWLVRYDGSLYRALAQTTGDQPDTSPAQWEKVGDYDSLGEAVAAALSMATQAADDIAAQVTRIDALYARMPTGTGNLATEAFVVAEAQALATEIQAEASRIDGLVARMPSGSGLLATQASVNDVASTAASATQAVANRTSTIEARMPAGSGQLATDARVTTVENASVNRDNALSERTDLISARIGAVEGVENPSFETDGGWNLASNAAIVEHDSARTGTRVMRFSAGAVSVGSISQTRVPVAEGQKVRAGVWARRGTVGGIGPNAGAELWVRINGYDKDGNYVSGSLQTIATRTGAQLTDDYYLVEGEYTVPSNIFSVALQIRAEGLTQGQIRVDDAYLQVDSRSTRLLADAVTQTQAEVSQQGADLSALSGTVSSHTASINAINGRMPSGSGTLATASALSSTQAQVDSQAGQISGISSRVDQVEVDIDGVQGSVTQLSEVVGSAAGGNGAANPGFEGDSGWDLGGGAYIQSGSVRSGAQALHINSNGFANNTVRVTAPQSRRVRAGAWVRWATSRPNAWARVTVRCYSSTGAHLRDVDAVHITEGSATTTYAMRDGVVTLAADVARVSLRIYSSGSHTSGLWLFDDAFLEPVSEGESRMMARHTVALNVNGHVSGTVSENDGERSSFSILATVFRVISGPTAGLEWQDGYLRAYAFGAQVVLGVNFGASNDLMMWAGPNVGANNCTKSNGTFWLDNVGNGYFGGQVMQGVLRWFNSTTSTSATASVTTGSNPRLGKQVALAARYSYQYMVTYRGTGAVVTPGSGTTQVTVHIERRYGTGAWTSLHSETITGSADAFNDPNTIATWTVRMQGQFYATDTASGSNSEYRARISGRSIQSHTGDGQVTDPVQTSQYLSIEAME